MSVKHFCARAGCSNLVSKGQRFCPEHSQLKIYCAYVGCTELVSVTERYCEKHQPKRLADKHRENANKRGYSSRWSRISRLFLIANPVCSECRKAPAVLVHHIKPISEGGEIYDPQNLRGLCASCHAKIHAEISTRKHS